MLKFNLKDWLKGEITLPEFTFWKKVNYCQAKKHLKFDETIEEEEIQKSLSEMTHDICKNFRKKYKIEKDSPEELAIAELILKGFDADEAVKKIRKDG